MYCNTTPCLCALQVAARVKGPDVAAPRDSPAKRSGAGGVSGGPGLLGAVLPGKHEGLSDDGCLHTHYQRKEVPLPLERSTAGQDTTVPPSPGLPSFDQEEQDDHGARRVMHAGRGTKTHSSQPDPPTDAAQPGPVVSAGRPGVDEGCLDHADGPTAGTPGGPGTPVIIGGDRAPPPRSPPA
ncbi:collagen alpha-1(I) chain-like [Watersipora subatra]|uniref:collagen alpha-1(I) chain-like n=1 Tax=Watersipora subatra TaxID=2589382 RepID=UPI00355ADA6B